MSPFVLLHGFTGSPESFDPLLAHLPAHPTTLRPWLSGHGPTPTFAASWNDEIDGLIDLLRQQRVERAHLVGYSLGGRIGFGLLARAPELFFRATLIGAHPGLRDSRERQVRRAQDARWLTLLEENGLEAFIDAWEALPLWSTQSTTVRERLRLIRRSHRADGLAHSLRVLGLASMPPIDPLSITTPVRLVVGALDGKYRAIAERLAPQLGATLSVVPGTGHNVLAEAPAALAELLA